MDHPRYACGVNVALDVVGSKWKPSIIWELGQGVTRFAALRRALGTVSEKVLTEQLRELIRDGIVERRAYDGFPLRVEYTLTRSGGALNDALDAVATWGEENVSRVERARMA